MKFTLSWLRDHLDSAATAAEVAEAMTMAGLEVEADLFGMTVATKDFREGVDAFMNKRRAEFQGE